MDTKLEARGQFPASFPDTFKNFFAMMNEDEDHVGLFANLLEDKVIPRQNSPVPVQRQRYGGSMRSHSGGDSSGRADRHYHPPQQAQGQQHNMSVYHSRSRSGSGSSNSEMVSGNAHASGSRSESRNRSHGGEDAGHGGSSVDLSQGQSPSQNQNQPKRKPKVTATTTSGAERRNSGGNITVCKHIQFCCIHQEEQAKADPGKKHVKLVCDCERQREKQLRLGPDGDENCGVIKLQGYVYGVASPLLKPSKLTQNVNATDSNDEPRSPSPCSTAAAKNKSLQERQERSQARHSLILERAFDFDFSCDECDNINSGNPVPSPAPHQLAYNMLKPILKQPQKHQQHEHQHEHQHQHHHHHQHKHMHTQQQQQAKPNTPKPVHRMLPTPPTYSGLGAYHTREAALQRVQQQSGFGSRSNLNTIPATPYTQGPSTSAAAAAAAAAYNAYNQALEQSVQQLQQVSFEPKQPQQPQQPQYDSQHAQFDQQQMPYDQGQFEQHQKSYVDDEQQFLGHQQQYAEHQQYEMQQQQQQYEMQQQQQQYEMQQQQQQYEMQYDEQQQLQQQQQQQQQQMQYPEEWEYNTDSTTQQQPLSTFNDFLNAAQNPTGSRQSLRAQKSPIMNKRRASSIAGNLLHSEYNYSTRNSIGGAPLDPDDFQRISHSSSARDRMSMAGVLTFQQAMSGAVSPQYGPIGRDQTDLMPGSVAGQGAGERGGGGGGFVGGLGNVSGGLPGGSAHNLSVGIGLGFLGGSSTTLTAVAEVTSGPDATSSDSLSPVTAEPGTITTTRPTPAQQQQQQQQQQLQRERGVGVGESLGVGSASNSNMTNLAAAIAQPGRTLLERQRMRTSSMPAESRRPRLAEMRRSAIHTGDLDIGYYRLRSFSITSHGICNLGDSLRSRRSRSINSVTSTGTSNSGVDRHNSNASRVSGEVAAGGDPTDGDPNVPAYKIAMLGGSGVGKTTLTYQFTTSDYICAYDLSLDDDYGQKTVSVLVDNIETDLEIIDHPACEMSTEAFCATYNIDLFVVVYSVVDRTTFKAAERVLQYLKENEMLLSRGAILVANKTDLERHRVVTRQMGCKVANQIPCKFIETSSGLDHNVDELLVGIVAQVKLNPQRLRRLTELELQRLNLQSTIQKHRGMHLQKRRMVRQMSICHGDDEEIFNGGQQQQQQQLQQHQEEEEDDEEEDKWRQQAEGGGARKARVENPNRKPLNLESILKMGESELEDGDGLESSTHHHHHHHQQQQQQQQQHQMTKFEMLTANEEYRHRTPRRPAFRKRRSFDGAIFTSTAAAAMAELQRRHELRALDDSQILDDEERLRNRNRDRERDRNGSDDEEEAGGTDAEAGRSSCNRKVVKKLTARTKVFISSVLRFKKSINLRRRNSSSCSDLFVI